MLEYWNDGMLGFGKMRTWDIGNISLNRKWKVFIKKQIFLITNPAKDGIFDFPIFHYSIIPCVR